MRAVVREKGMVFRDDYATPRPPKAGTDEVLLRVCAAGINPADYKAPKMMIGPVVGLDVAGVVVARCIGSAGCVKYGWPDWRTAVFASLRHFRRMASTMKCPFLPP